LSGRIFFTSDTHFGDPNVNRIHARPFASIAEMDAALTENWNRTVGPDDTVYHLGDFAHRECLNGRDYVQRLNGHIHLIAGNHDELLIETAGDLFASVELMREIDWRGRRFVLFHYPMREWPNAIRGACHLYGHVHGAYNATPIGCSLDVGSDCHGFAPVSIETVSAIFDARQRESAA